MSLGRTLPALLVVVAVCTHPVAAGRKVQCETLPSNIHISKDEFSAGGQLERTCEGDVPVNKCEGACSSQVRPSVVSHTGFNKECSCCKETTLREREIILRSCYDPDGQRIAGTKGTLTVKLREPADCRCSKCAD